MKVETTLKNVDRRLTVSKMILHILDGRMLFSPKIVKHNKMCRKIFSVTRTTIILKSSL